GHFSWVTRHGSAKTLSVPASRLPSRSPSRTRTLNRSCLPGRGGSPPAQDWLPANIPAAEVNAIDHPMTFPLSPRRNLGKVAEPIPTPPKESMQAVGCGSLRVTTLPHHHRPTELAR